MRQLLCPICDAPLTPNEDGTQTCYRCISKLMGKYLREKELLIKFHIWASNYEDKNPPQVSEKYKKEMEKIKQSLSGKPVGYDQTVLIDFDNTISYTPNYAGEKVLGPPITGAKEAIKKLKKHGKKIIIFTTRAEWEIKEWLQKHDIPYDEINKNTDLEGTNPGKPIGNVLVDDRCITFNGKWNDKLISKILNYKPYYRR